MQGVILSLIHISGMVAHDGQKVVRFVVLIVLGVLFIKIVSGA